MKRTHLLLLITLSLLPLLNGCAAIVAGGVATGALVAHDRRTSGAIVQDQQIELSALTTLRDHRDIADHSRISITSYNMRVLLTGQAETDEAARRFAALVSELPHVRSVYNEIRVGASAGWWDESEDTYLTSKVKLALIDAGLKGFDPALIKVVTSQEEVFLMGLVTEAEGRAVVEKTRSVSGVQRVVEVFEYIKD